MSSLHHHHEESSWVYLALTAICGVTLLTGWVLSSSASLVGPVSVSQLLYCIAYLSGGWFAAKRSFGQLRRGHMTVDVLMLLAAAGAYIVKEVPEGGFLLFLFSLSGALEQLILGRTRSEIRKLVDFHPTEATVLRDGKEIRVNVEEVAVHDRVLIRPGERVSVDGIIRSGTSSLDQSPLTGESIPVDKAPGDVVLAGTLNLQGALEIECERRGEETTLARLIQLVEVAQSEKAESETISRWFGERYTIAVIVLAAVSFVGILLTGVTPGEAFYRAMTVLVVASPCAIVISVPAAILSAIANAARNGVLIKGGIYLERLATLDALAFDKTGTFTLGKPRVVLVSPAQGVSEDLLVASAKAAELLSEHPLAKAVVREANSRNLVVEPADSLSSVPGKGVIAVVNGETIYLGKPALFEESGITITDEIRKSVADSQLRGWTTMLVGRNERILGVIAIADTLRPRAAETLQQLRELGLKRFIMLTGDNERVAAEVAKQLGSEFAADLLPEEKLVQLRALRKGMRGVGMIGDGVNDAPSLAAADVGLSLGSSGTGVAIEAADVVLMGDDLSKLTFAVRLAKTARTVIQQNLVFAAGVMLLLLITSIFYGIRMPLAVVGHEGSTVLVILNGLRLLWTPAKPALSGALTREGA